MADTPQASSLTQSVRELATMVGDAGRLRLKLATLEGKQFLGLCLTLLVLALLAAVCLLAAFLLINFLVLYLFREHIYWAGGIMAVVYLLAAWGLHKKLRAVWDHSAPPLSGTLAELKQDLDVLQGKDA